MLDKNAINKIISNIKFRNTGQKLLHLAAKLSPYPELSSISCPALQMQRELLWFQAVEEFVHPSVRLLYDKKRPNSSRAVYEGTHEVTPRCRAMVEGHRKLLHGCIHPHSYRHFCSNFHSSWRKCRRQRHPAVSKRASLHVVCCVRCASSLFLYNCHLNVLVYPYGTVCGRRFPPSAPEEVDIRICVLVPCHSNHAGGIRSSTVYGPK
ncbi:uncharacterized protein LOC116189025 [Punica granatum]|uniref:Uncharacterized protein LOC116189025 n=1 Tax=Punica granatum TaxID=22663 RepID=A0A6P8BU09_PUNGR|nr:uncharacterized protein LOC116189025 [Punica granatum]